MVFLSRVPAVLFREKRPLSSYFEAPTNTDITYFRRDDEVLHYLEDYSKDILQYIRFDTLVNRIRKIPKKPDSCWIVDVANVKTSEMTTEEFDAVCDCTGHYTRPYIPYVRGLWNYKRRILHAKWFRKPDVFAGQVSHISSRYKLLAQSMLTKDWQVECFSRREQRVRVRYRSRNRPLFQGALPR